jgi:fibronectin-binding autotransporter adhesin
VTVSGTQSLGGLTIEEGSVTQKGGTLDFGSTANAQINVAAGSTFFEDNTDTAYSTFAGTGGLVKVGTGTLILRGFNTFSKSGSGDQAYLLINDGVVDFLGEATLGAIQASSNSTALTLNGGTLREFSTSGGGGIGPNRSTYIGANGGTFDFQGIAEYGIGGLVTSQFGGTGTLTKTGASRLKFLRNTGTFAGKYVVQQGSICVTNDAYLGATPASPRADYFTLNGGGISAEYGTHIAINSNRGITLGPNGGFLAGTQQGTDFDGIVTGSGGGKLTIALNDAVGINFLAQIGLGGANTYDGATQINPSAALSVKILADGGLPSGIGRSSSAPENLIFNGGTLNYTGPATTTDRNFTLTASGGGFSASGASNAALTFTSTAPITMTGSGPRNFVLRGTSAGNNIMSLAIVDHVTDATTLYLDDSANWVLTNTANSYSGLTYMRGGTLKLGASGVIPDNSTLNMSSSTARFDLNGFNETIQSAFGIGTLSLGSNTLTLASPNNDVYTGRIIGTGGGRIVKNGSGRWVLGNSLSAYDGGLVLNAGGLGIAFASDLGTGTFVVNSSVTLGATGSGAINPSNPVTLNGNLTFDDSFTSSPGAITWNTSAANKWTITGANQTLTINSAAGGYAVTINQVIAQDAPGRGLTKSGNGRLTLGGVNTYTGDTTISGGTLTINNAYLDNTADVYITSGSTFNLNFFATDTIDSLFIDGVSKATGTWGSLTSNASHKTSLLTGPGVLLVSTYAALPGDFNNNGAVEAGDYVLWRKGPGYVPADYDNWRSHFGQPSGAGSGSTFAAVPEPASMMLFVVALAFIGGRLTNSHKAATGTARRVVGRGTAPPGQSGAP